MSEGKEWTMPSKHVYNRHMKKVSIAELKNRLSQYLRYVKAGEPVVIMERNQPVAHMIPIPPPGKNPDERLSRLEARGIVRRGRSARLRGYQFPDADGAESGVVEALRRERETGR
ncbi:MAG: type II toxin-antitoxin system prevent-host-death family antitoxin [Deltaproteobacteria bacterium]|nr:type II toxin-antitoxin system prevent-host-death family antitoxin [Deltaproteobacteria bacterium]